ncbi:SWIB/MDM2 domain-containing protein [Paraflavisolibacter sp. H34]|uniref:SWIB/MDM2 domain-containing protein n=1 Tax=Huijunlia imazamoxiresistens TaxID=3127457 RepID=UPI003018244D
MAKAVKKAAPKKAAKKAAPSKASVKKAAPKKAAVKKAAPKKAAPKKAAPKKAVAKAAPKAAKKAAPKKAARKTARRVNTALMTPVTVSAVLARVVGEKPMPRTEIVSKMWDYIRKKGLQDQANRRMINADDTLREIFGGKNQISMFELAKILNQHVQK